MKIKPILFFFFFFAMFLPTSLSVNLGFMRLTPYRILLIFFFLTNLGKILSHLRFKKSDPGFFMMIFGGWSILALWVNHDLATALEAGGINFIELVAPFFIASAYIKDEKRLDKVVRMMVWTVVGLLTISLPETLTGFNWFRTITDAVSGGRHSHIDPRFGFDRAIATFDHAIINGVVSSSVIGFAYFCMKWWVAAFPVVATATSLSSGAVAAIMIQFLVISWEKVVKVKKRWWILFSILLSIYIAAELISNRSGIMAILSIIVFSQGTAYNRYYIFIHGSDNVIDNPMFGIGFNDWVRPSYMGSSVDNYWLLIAMRYGLPALIAYACAIYLIVKHMFRYRVKDHNLTMFRRGWLCGFVGLCLSGATVHYWNAAYIYFNFYIGLGLAMLPILKNQYMSERANLRT